MKRVPLVPLTPAEALLSMLIYILAAIFLIAIAPGMILVWCLAHAIAEQAR